MTEYEKKMARFRQLVKECADAGIEFIELPVAIDGLSVITNEGNPLECLSFADLYALAGVMYATRKIDWSGVARRGDPAAVEAEPVAQA